MHNEILGRTTTPADDEPPLADDSPVAKPAHGHAPVPGPDEEAEPMMCSDNEPNQSDRSGTPPLMDEDLDGAAGAGAVIPAVNTRTMVDGTEVVIRAGCIPKVWPKRGRAMDCT